MSKRTLSAKIRSFTSRRGGSVLFDKTWGVAWRPFAVGPAEKHQVAIVTLNARGKPSERNEKLLFSSINSSGLTPRTHLPGNFFFCLPYPDRTKHILAFFTGDLNPSAEDTSPILCTDSNQLIAMLNPLQTASAEEVQQSNQRYPAEVVVLKPKPRE